MNQKAKETHSGRLNDALEEPIRILQFGDVIKFPELHQQKGSLTPLEKAQIGLLIAAVRPKLIVETGVWRGRTTRFISELLRLNNIPGIVYGFDLPEVIDELLDFDPFFSSAANVKLIRGVLPNSLEKWVKEEQPQIEFAIIDAYHSYYAAYTELSAIGPYLGAKAYVFCHDYDLDIKNHEGVLCGVNDFAKKNGFAVLPLISETASPKTDRSAQAAILRRNLRSSFPRQVMHLREYTRQRYPRLAAIWDTVRHQRT